MRARTAKAARNSRSNTTVSFIPASAGTAVRRRGRAGDRHAVAGGRDVVLGAWLAAVGGIGPGQLAAALGPYRATVQDQGRVAAQHADQHGMDLHQQAAPCPLFQISAQEPALANAGVEPLAWAAVARRRRQGVP